MLGKDNCVFSVNGNGFLSAVIDGKDVGRVKLVRALPLTEPDRYISVMNMSNDEFGIIENISDFGEDQRELILGELAMRYFCPSITEIDDIKEKMGQFFFDVHIGEIKKHFTVRDISANVRQYPGFILITDSDGNRYKIENGDKIKKKSFRKLEPYLY